MPSNVLTTARFIALVGSSFHSYSHSNVQGNILKEFNVFLTVHHSVDLNLSPT
jgi:hypothetical protein